MQFTEYNPTFHSGLCKTLIRTAGYLNDKSYFIFISDHTLPTLIQPCGELSGVYLRCILKLYGYDEGMQYFLQCSPYNKHYRVIVPEMLFGLYENGYYEECISLYDILCDDYGWEPFPKDSPSEQDAYYQRQQHLKLLRHSRVYSAAIGSHLALGDYEEGLLLYKEMHFWGLTPLRETYYDFITVWIL